jgi:hypothetical protein
MENQLLAEIESVVGGLPFPASKDEVLQRLAEAGASDELVWLVQAVPGTLFQFRHDLLSTARIALEMDMQHPWPEHAAPREFVSDEGLVDLVRQRLTLSRQTNAHLIRVQARAGVVQLDGRAADVPSGVMATRVALGLVPGRRVVNNLDVQA